MLVEAGVGYTIDIIMRNGFTKKGLKKFLKHAKENLKGTNAKRRMTLTG